MSNKSTFFTNRLNNNIYPLTYSVKTKYDINVLYFTVAGVDDVYKLIRDKVNAWLYIFDVGHYMEKDGIYLALKEILEKNKIEADFMYEDDIIAIKKEKFNKFFNFPQYDFKMFDYDRVMNEEEFSGFYKEARAGLKNLETFLHIKAKLPKYFINCHDDSLLYCETRDLDLKNELLRGMLHDYFEVYLDKNHKMYPDISIASKEFTDELFDKWDKITIREEGTRLKNNDVEAFVFDGEDKEAGTLIYKIDKKEWTVKAKRK